jgi:hypothetical protein
MPMNTCQTRAMSKDVFFHLDRARHTFPVGVILGVCRSGKTTLTSVLATCQQAESADEPWTAMQLPMVARHGHLEETLAAGWLRAYMCELFNELVLLRRANFRPNDLSSVWTKKVPSEILNRLCTLHSRTDVERYAEENGSTLLLTLAECAPFADIILAACPHAKLIHVVRNGFDVANDVCQKQWLSDEQLIAPRNVQLYRRVEHEEKIYFLPWWVDPSDSVYFIGLTEYERALYYWCSLTEKGLKTLNACSCNDFIVRYEEFVVDPKATFLRVAEFLEFRPGAMTESALAAVAKRTKMMHAEVYDKSLYSRVQALNVRLKVESDEQ